MSMMQDILTTFATAVVILMYCCLSGDHPLAPSLTVVITISLIQFHFLAFARRPIAKRATKKAHAEDEQTGVWTAFLDALSVAAKRTYRFVKRNALVRTLVAYVACLSTGRFLRSQGMIPFNSIFDVVMVAFPSGVITCWALVAGLDEKVSQRGSSSIQKACSMCGDLDCNGYPNCPSCPAFWDELPGAEELLVAEPAEQEWDTASVLEGIDKLFPAVASAVVS